MSVGGGPVAARELIAPRGGPRVVLLVASGAACDERALRARARSLCGEADAAFASRSYSHPFALVALHSCAVGVDIELADGDGLDEAFARTICTPRERELGLAVPGARLASLWSGKEALVKVLGDAASYDARRLDSPLCWPDGRSGPWRASPLDLSLDASGRVGWVCWRDSV